MNMEPPIKHLIWRHLSKLNMEELLLNLHMEAPMDPIKPLSLNVEAPTKA